MAEKWSISAVICVNVTLIVVLLCLVEGLSGFTVVAYRALISPPLAERRHTEHDPLLGWVHQPGITIPNMYGEGRTLTINAQRLRALHDFTVQPPAGLTRAVCSGDSFTLGNGVGDNDTWCAILQQLEPRLETVNMGQGGYGMDQIDLWYRRDGARLAHDIHLFAFVTEDIVRMTLDDFLGYPKPRLALQNDELVTLNVPLPSPNPLRTFYNLNLRRLDTLATMRVARRLLGSPAAQDGEAAATQLRAVLAAMVRRLAGDGGDSPLRVLVHLPMLSDYTGTGSNPWSAFLAEEARSNGLPFINLIDAQRSLPPHEVEDLYIGAEDTEHIDTPGHLNERGNRVMATLLLERLRALPEFERLLAR